MRARPEAEPIAVAPVHEVVPARLSRPRPIRDLVLLVARLRHSALRPLVHRRLYVVVRLRHAPMVDVVRQLGPLLNRQRVQRHVLRRQPNRLLQSLLPAFQRLIRQPVDEVEVDAREASLARPCVPLLRLLRRVNAVERQQFVVVERLHPETQPVRSERDEPPQVVEIDRAGVRLQRDLSVRVDREVLAHRSENRFEFAHRHQARRTTAEEDRRDWPPRHRRRPEAHLLAKRPREVGHKVVQLRVRIEVAVRTLQRAKRDVDVQRKQRTTHATHPTPRDALQLFLAAPNSA